MTASRIGSAQIPAAVDSEPAQGRGRVRIFLFFGISLLVHLWAIVDLRWPNTPPGVPTYSRPLTVRILARQPPETSPATNEPEDVPFDEPEPSGKSQPAPVISQERGSTPSARVSGSPPSGVGERPEETFGKSAREIIEQAKAAIPEIVKETQPSVIGPAQVFDPKFRRRLERARWEKARQDELMRQLAQRPLSEVIGEYGDYVKVRIGEKCWRMPVREDSGALYVRIPMWDPQCGGHEPLRVDIGIESPKLLP